MRFFVPIPCTPARIRYSSGRGWRLGIHAGPFARVYTHGKQTKVRRTVPDTSFSIAPLTLQSRGDSPYMQSILAEFGTGAIRREARRAIRKAT